MTSARHHLCRGHAIPDIDALRRCPIHTGRDRTFSINFDDNVFRYFEANCQMNGDVIGLGDALYNQSLRDTVLDLVGPLLWSATLASI